MKTTFKYDHYYKYDELETCLQKLSKAYPDLMKLDINCISEENRNQYVASITNFNTGDIKDKPALYIDGNIHAGEVTSSMCAMHTIDYLLTNYSSDDSIKNLLDTTGVYVIPRVSPDGVEAYLTTPYTLRSVNREYLKQDGGIKQEDLDNDGVIRMMKIPSRYGAWKIDEDNNLTLRSPSDDNGDFFDIYPEGVFEDYEGSENLKIRKNDFGLDFNRNFPFGWFPEPRQAGAGKYPLSNIETKAIADFVIDHPNICGAAIGHTSGGIILYPPGTKPSDKIPESDLRVLKEIAKMAEQQLGYKAINIYDTFLSDQQQFDSGALDDWMFETQGIPAFTMEFWDLASKVGMPVDWNSKKKDPYESIKRFNETIKWVKENAPEYYLDWKEYDHPKFGKVEIGGFNYKFTHQNPPEKFLLKELEANTLFNIRFMKSLPRLVIEEYKIENIKEDIYKLDLVIGNIGYLSTNLTQTALNMKTVKPITVSVEGCEIISGKKESEIDNLQGYSSTSTGVFYYGNISTTSNGKAKKKLSWIIQTKQKEITINIKHQKAGNISKSLSIG